MGLTQPHRGGRRHRRAGICFYQSYAREMAEANGWHRLLTNSAKLVNIIGGYGYKPDARQHGACVDSAVAGKGAVMPIVLECHQGHRPRRHRHGAGRGGQFLRALRSRPHRRASSRAPRHKLHGQSYVGKVLVLDTAKGGVASAWMLREMAARGMAPLAIIFDRANTILAQGAAFADWRWSTASRRAGRPS